MKQWRPRESHVWARAFARPVIRGLPPPARARTMRAGMVMLRFSFVLAAAALAGCGSTTTGLEATGRGTMPSARISFELGRHEAPPSDPHPGSAIELGYSRGKASGSQSLPAGGSSTLGGQTFSGPVNLKNEAELQFIDALWRTRGFMQNGVLGGEVVLGLSHAALDYTSTAPGQRATDQVSNLGATVGLGGILRLRPGTSLQARYTWLSAGGVFTETNARRFDISAAQALGRNLVLRAGYASWQYSTDQNTGSKLNAHLSGPTLGLELGL